MKAVPSQRLIESSISRSTFGLIGSSLGMASRLLGCRAPGRSHLRRARLPVFAAQAPSARTGYVRFRLSAATAGLPSITSNSHHTMASDCCAVRLMCRVLLVSLNGYDAWRSRVRSKRS